MDMDDRLAKLDQRLKIARMNHKAQATLPPPRGGNKAELAALEAEINELELQIAALVDSMPAFKRAEADTKAAREDAEKRRGTRIVEGLKGCGVPAFIALVVVAAAVFFGMDFLGDDEDPDAKCSRPTQTLGGVQVQLVADDCEPTPTPTASATDPDTAPDAGKPDAADLPAGQVLYQGTTGGQLGCIACDGQSRFINIDKSTTAKGDAERAGQEIVWPENGVVVDFGIQIPQPNEGRYGINLFVNGAYSVGCPIETGSRSCRVLEGQDPSPLAAGDRVTIIVGEQGIVDEDGVPVEEGDFVLEWWFVFQPE
jgi:hypothetical protein